VAEKHSIHGRVARQGSFDSPASSQSEEADSLRMTRLIFELRDPGSSLLRVYFAGNEGDGEAACPALAWINFSTAGTITSSI